jgi:hypothetical protein
MLPAAAPVRARREPRYVLGAASLRRNRSEDGPRGETITEEGRPSAASGEDYLLTTSGPIRVRRRYSALALERRVSVDARYLERAIAVVDDKDE